MSEQTPERGSIVYDYRAPLPEPKTIVYCWCAGKDCKQNECGCYGTVKFYGPERL